VHIQAILKPLLVMHCTTATAYVRGRAGQALDFSILILLRKCLNMAASPVAPGDSKSPIPRIQRLTYRHCILTHTLQFLLQVLNTTVMRTNTKKRKGSFPEVYGAT
jgi:hypothetical protein